MCTDEYVLSKGGAGVTLEMGQLGISDWATNLTLTTMTRALTAASRIKTSDELEGLIESEQLRDLDFFEITYAEPFSEAKMQLDPGWITLAQVQEGTVIGKRGDNSAFTAPPRRHATLPEIPKPNRLRRRKDAGTQRNLQSCVGYAGPPTELWPEL